MSIVPFDDFAATFVDWLVSAPMLSGFWQGDVGISSPDVKLFAEAAAAADHQAYWKDEDVPDESEEGADADDEGGYSEDEGAFASRSLESHLPQKLIDEVRERLRDNPEYVAPRIPAASWRSNRQTPTMDRQVLTTDVTDTPQRGSDEQDQ